MTFHNIVFRFLGILILVSITFESFGKTNLRGHGLADSWRTYKQLHATNPPAFQFKYDSCFRSAARRNDLPLTLLLAVARGESDFNPRAISKANAIGIMQILWPGTAHDLGIKRKSDLFKPCTNIQAGARYLKFLVDRYSGDYNLAIAAYNYGPNRIKQNGSVHSIPKGAQWYSSYIYDHLQYVLGQGSGIRKPPIQSPLPVYSELGRYSVIIFNKPFRARAFREYLQSRLTNVRFDWFNKGLGRFEVVMMYNGRKEFRRNLNKLKALGIALGPV